MEQPKITIEQIETKEFGIVKRDGYDPREVDEFLDLIMDEMARQIDEIARLNHELKAANARPVPQAPVQPVQLRGGCLGDEADTLGSLQEDGCGRQCRGGRKSYFC